MRAAILHGPGDLRVEEVAEPVGEVVVEVRAATTCGTDAKMLRHGHPMLGPYPARASATRRPGCAPTPASACLVGDSVPCGACPPCRAGRTNLCRAMTWVLGGFAERDRRPGGGAAPGAGRPAVRRRGDGRAAGRLRARGRAWRPEREVAVLGGGTDRADARPAARRSTAARSRVVDRHPERRAQADDLGARGVAALEPGRCRWSFEAVGRPEALARGVGAGAPGGDRRHGRRLPARGDVALPARRCTTTRSTSGGAFHHRPAEVDEALALLSNGAVDHAAFAGPGHRARRPGAGVARGAPRRRGEARKLVVDPAR